MFQSITYGSLTKENMFNIIMDKVKDREEEFILTVGTDSQSLYKGSVVALHHVGKGGIFFYEIKPRNKI